MNMDDVKQCEPILSVRSTLSRRSLGRHRRAASRRRGSDSPIFGRASVRSRPAVDRLLDPANPSVTLSTLERAAAAVGRRLIVELAEASR
jgi:antitoxin HicB